MESAFAIRASIVVPYSFGTVRRLMAEVANFGWKERVNYYY